MHDIPNRIADVLLEVEASLRVHGKWDEHKPDPNDLSSTIPFCMDTLKGTSKNTLFLPLVFEPI